MDRSRERERESGEKNVLYVREKEKARFIMSTTIIIITMANVPGFSTVGTQVLEAPFQNAKRRIYRLRRPKLPSRGVNANFIAFNLKVNCSLLVSSC